MTRRESAPTFRRGLVAAALLGVLIGVGVPSSIEAQSLFSTRGLGSPVDGLDARARAMGSSGIGLFGTGLLASDPTMARGLFFPTVSASMQPLFGTFDEGAVSGDVEGVRFPVIAVAYPTRWGVIGLSYGGFLDQRWNAVQENEVELTDGPVEVVDRFESDGGIARAEVALTRALGPSFTLAVGAGLHTGKVDRSFTRSFDSLAVEGGLRDFEDSGRWSFSGPTASVALAWQPSQLFRVAGGVRWSGTMEASPEEETAGDARDYDLPLEYRVGASVRLTPRFGLHASGEWADWSEIGALEDGSEGQSVLRMGAGLEYDGARLFGRRLPLRLGYRVADLPFGFPDEDPSEQAFTGGFGLALAEVEGIPLALADFAVERAERTGGSLEESFWRLTLSFRVSTN